MILNRIIRNINKITAFGATTFYIEIMYVMFAFMFIYGKWTAVIIGLILSVLLTFHIIYLYMNKNFSRMTHLFLIDIHAALSFAYIINTIAYPFEGKALEITIFASRLISCVLEIPLIWFLTRKDVIDSFKENIKEPSPAL